MNKRIEEMSADELYALAKRKEQEEEEKQRAVRQAEIDKLREKRKQLLNEQKKALAAIDKQIKEMGGRVRTAAGGRQRGQLSEQILSTIAAAGNIKTTELRNKLAANGIDTKNLNQQLAYLKRKGRISNPDRGVYAIVK